MKTASLWFVVFFVCQTVFAQASMITLSEPKAVGFTVQPLAILFGDYQLQTEFRVSDLFSIVVPAGLLAPNWSPFYLWTGIDPSNINGIAFPGWIAGAGIGPRVYPFGKALASGPYFQFLFFVGAGQTFGLQNFLALVQQRFHVGYAWVTELGFTAEVFGGFQQSNFSNIEGQGFVSTAGIGIGWAL